MKKIPWTLIGAICMVLALLVVGRCAVTAGRVLYYGGTNWKEKVLADPWFYVGMVSSALCAATFMISDWVKRKKPEETEE